MAVEEMMKSITEELGETANVKRVFGEPTTVGRKTIIPIATVGVGFGAGGGKGKGHHAGEPYGEEDEGEGGGGAGKGASRPIAILEVTDDDTKLIPIIDITRIVLSGIFFTGAMTYMITKLIARLHKC